MYHNIFQKGGINQTLVLTTLLCLRCIGLITSPVKVYSIYSLVVIKPNVKFWKKKSRFVRQKKKYSNSENKFLNETKKHNPPNKGQYCRQ
jgi:hypothetical protein